MYPIRKVRLHSSVNKNYMVCLSESYHTHSSASEQVISQASKTISRNKSSSFVMLTNGQVEMTNLKMRTIFNPMWIYCNTRNCIKCLLSSTQSFRSTKELYQNMNFCHFWFTNIQTEFALVQLWLVIPEKSNSITGLERPWRFQEFETRRFQDSRHVNVVRMSVLGAGLIYPQEMFLVFISVREWVNRRAIVRPERWCQSIIPMTRELPVCSPVPQAAAPPRTGTIVNFTILFTSHITTEM